MLKYFWIVFTLMTICCIGCGSDTPGCSDSETKELVIKIARDEIKNTFGNATAKEASLRLEGIRTQSVDDKTGNCSCAAELVIKSRGVEDKVSITYTTEITDKGDEFYVTVYGL